MVVLLSSTDVYQKGGCGLALMVRRQRHRWPQEGATRGFTTIGATGKFATRQFHRAVVTKSTTSLSARGRHKELVAKGCHGGVATMGDHGGFRNLI